MFCIWKSGTCGGRPVISSAEKWLVSRRVADKKGVDGSFRQSPKGGVSRVILFPATTYHNRACYFFPRHNHSRAVRIVTQRPRNIGQHGTEAQREYKATSGLCGKRRRHTYVLARDRNTPEAEGGNQNPISLVSCVCFPVRQPGRPRVVRSLGWRAVRSYATGTRRLARRLLACALLACLRACLFAPLFPLQPPYHLSSLSSRTRPWPGRDRHPAWGCRQERQGILPRCGDVLCRAVLCRGAATSERGRRLSSD